MTGRNAAILSLKSTNETCPCAATRLDSSLVTAIATAATDRLLQQSDDMTYSGDGTPQESENNLFQVIYTCVVLFLMFAALISDRIGADSVMMASLTFFMAANIITIEEGLEGFANEGLLTVLVLFVVADGISKTGALDWYMSRLLGRPATVAAAQTKLMIPIAIISAFLNNTPVVAVMIPIVQKWSKNIGQSAQQLLVPLSFASILGGTCTLIGTSTNLVVAGLLEKQYPEIKMGLFDLSIYGVPIAMVGIVYVLLASPCLLPGGKGASCRGGTGTGAIDITGGSGGNDSEQDLLLGAKLMPWSPAAGRSVKRSGLRDTGGIYLVSVHRAATGNVHRAVGQDFVLNVGDVLYFTGLVEEFGEFCEDHAMEVLTNELEEQEDTTENEGSNSLSQNVPTDIASNTEQTFYTQVTKERQSNTQLVTVLEGAEEEHPNTERSSSAMPVVEVGFTKESLLQADEAERSRIITRMIDTIRGVAREEPTQQEHTYLNIDVRERGKKYAQQCQPNDREGPRCSG